MEYAWCRERVFLIAAVLSVVMATGARAESRMETEPVLLARVSYIFDIAVDRTDPTRLLLATRSGVLRATPDGMASRVSRSSNGFWNLVAHPTEIETILARGVPDDEQSPAILVSHDSGRTWLRVSGSPKGRVLVRTLDISKALPEIVYGVNDDLWVSRSGGDSWARVGPFPQRVIDIAASSLDAETLYAATMSGVMVSRDGGKSWRKAFAETCLGAVTVIEAGWNGVVYAFSLCAGLLKADEKTGDWTIANNDFGGCIVQHLAIDPEDTDKLYAVLRCNKVLASTNGGLTWKTFGTDVEGIPSCPVNPDGRPEPVPLGSEFDRENIVYAVLEAALPMP